jgi:hypothetical protein
MKKYSESDIANFKKGGTQLPLDVANEAIAGIDSVVEYAEKLKFKINNGLCLPKALTRVQYLVALAQTVKEVLDLEVQDLLTNGGG